MQESKSNEDDDERSEGVRLACSLGGLGCLFACCVCALDRSID
jgi:hypothetical protein